MALSSAMYLFRPRLEPRQRFSAQSELMCCSKPVYVLPTANTMVLKKARSMQAFPLKKCCKINKLCKHGIFKHEPFRVKPATEKVVRKPRSPQFNCVTCARRGMSLEQRTHRTVMFQSLLLLGTSFATVEDAAHHTDARNCAQRRDPLRSLRKACASSCTSPSTAESGLILQPYRA